MKILYHESSQTFHLQNDSISYIMTILPGGHLAQLYFGRRITDREEFGYLLETSLRSQAAFPNDDGRGYSLEHLKLEYPEYGCSDFRQGAYEIRHENGSRLTDFIYEGHDITPGKPSLPGLPATYTEDDSEAETLTIHLADKVSGLKLDLLYTIFAEGGIIARSAAISNTGEKAVHVERVMSMCLDLPDAAYDMITLNGSWARERIPETRRLSHGLQGVESLRGQSSHQHNPFVALKRPNADERNGEAIGFSLVYSGNFLAQVQVDNYDVTRVMIGINPTWFDWQLAPGESFQTPEAVIVYSSTGLNGMSQTYHRLYQKRLARGYWRDRVRPILINNWEATYFNFNESKLLSIAEKAKECGVELFVLDDGWFGERRNDYAGLGDWYPAASLLPHGLAGLAERIEAMGLKFGLWIEPEMVNPNSDLFRAHPDWILHLPDRKPSLSRHQLVLDFSRKEVVDHIHGMIAGILRGAKISYIKWDFNRSLTECGSAALPAERQGEVFHRYVLGVYDLYDRLTKEFPDVLFESCAGGGGRFDPGMLYYAPQAWCSDDTDAVERMSIQYGSSFVYPLSSTGSHVSAVPNHQVNRVTPLKTRADVAFFGTYGYELDLNKLTEEEQKMVTRYTVFMKRYRELIQFGTFYRLVSPIETDSCAWMVVSEDKKEAIFAYYRILNRPNMGFERVKLEGLLPGESYGVWSYQSEDVPPEGILRGSFYGDELMNAGFIVSDLASSKVGDNVLEASDFISRIYHLKA